VGASVAFTSDAGSLIEKAKPRMAFQLGAMGSAKTNFYNDAYKRSGFEEAATLVQKLWVEGRREEAAAEVPDDMIATVAFRQSPTTRPGRTTQVENPLRFQLHRPQPFKQAVEGMPMHEVTFRESGCRQVKTTYDITPS
jgi:hypothetical protein